MIKYSGSYANTERNFVFINLENQDKISDGILYSLLCVVQNIILRGNVTIPSDYLCENLGTLEHIDAQWFMVSNQHLKWNIIKGDEETLDYPAEVFFEEKLPIYLEEYRFLTNLIVPEADFFDVLGHSSALDGQQVDFYIPQIRTVIEIDGLSHEDVSQVYKDGIRDKVLYKEGISVIRITTNDLEKETNDFKIEMLALLKRIRESEWIKQYVSSEKIDTNNIRIKYDTILRLQLFFLENFKVGNLSMKADKINVNIVNTDVPNLDTLLDTAYEDLKLWMMKIAQLLKYEISFPTLSLNMLGIDNSVNLDFSIFCRYTDETQITENTIYIRNDYFYNNNYIVDTSDTLQYCFSKETEEEDNNSLLYLLKNIFGFESFNAGQLPIIKNTLMRHDTIGILPTGGGKSLTYQLCALLQPGVTIAVVPIISLMLDQKKAMDNRKLERTAHLSSINIDDEKTRIMEDFLRGKYQLLWVSPERFQNEEFRKVLSSINREKNFALAVIDEVHCLSEWGHDFRVSYLALVKSLKTYCPEACLLGLTATASQAVLEDLKVEFEVDGEAIKALASMERDELQFKRIHVDSQAKKMKIVADIVKENDIEYKNSEGETQRKIGLIFCPTVNGRDNGCNNVKAYLDRKFSPYDIGCYHGQLENKHRSKIQEEFMSDKYKVMICTKAFGMGIDKGNIKYTIHFSLPQSVESFYQEAGRAGRERDKSIKSNCYILYYSGNDTELPNINKIFLPNTEVDERKRLSKQLQGDLSTIMFFWNNNKKTIDEEFRDITTVLEKLKLGVNVLKFGRENDKGIMSLNKIQASLYKLSLLGIVENWSIKYASLEEGTVHIDYSEIGEKEVLHHLLTYINKYDVEFRFDVDSIIYHDYYEMANDRFLDKLSRYIMILIKWGNENILYNRLQSTYTMLQWMAPEISDEQFRSNVTEYFRLSERTIIYDGIIYNPLEYDRWFDILYSKDIVTNRRMGPINESMAEAHLASLQRYLESYRHNTGLNFLSGFLRICTGRYRGTEGEWRFEEALKNIKETMNVDEQNDLIKMTACAGENMGEENKDILSMEILKTFPGKEELIFGHLNDRYTLSVLIQNPVKKLKTIVKEYI